MDLDSKDKQLLMLLQKNCRMLLTDLSAAIGLSIDSTHKRLKKLLKEKVFYPQIIIDPRKIGYPLAVDVKIKLKDIDEQTYKKLLSYLIELPYVISVFSTVGEHDLTAPIVARDHTHYQEISLDIRKKFKTVIADWKGTVNLEIFKYEYYDLKRL